MAVFAGARTQDLMGLSIRLAGFEIRDTLGWIYGSGMPKSVDVSKVIDKAAGAERKVVGTYDRRSVYDMGDRSSDGDTGDSQCAGRSSTVSVTTPATSEAARWDGWGTALKPAIEPIILARKSLDGTVANNVLTYDVGGLNIDACRVHMGSEYDPKKIQRQDSDTSGMKGLGGSGYRSDHVQPTYNPAGRFPANVLLDEHAAKEMDKQSGVSKSVRSERGAGKRGDTAAYGEYGTLDDTTRGHSDSGGASRFFPVFKYQAKAPKRERPVIEREDGTKIQHPTVKPLTLLEWLVALITPPGGVVLDPFAGSGTTLQAAINKGFQPIGIEQNADYIKLIEKRLEGLCTTHKN